MLHGQTRYCLPSLFLEELPEELLRKVGHTPAFAPETPAFVSAPKRQSDASAGGFRIGQSVQHAKFGLGVIVSAEGGADAKVQINFGAHGMKWLSLAYAKLTPA